MQLKRNRLFAAVSVLAVASCAAIAVPRAVGSSHARPRAHAAEVAALHNYHSGKCMGLENGSNVSGTRVIQWDCNGHSSQDWNIIYQSSRWILVNQQSYKCLDVKGNSSANGAQLIEWPCNAADTAQRFLINPHSGDFYTIEHPGGCVEVKSKSTANGALVDQWNCNGGSNQLWWYP